MESFHSTHKPLIAVLVLKILMQHLHTVKVMKQKMVIQWIAGWLSCCKSKLAWSLNHRSKHFTHEFHYLISQCFDLWLSDHANLLLQLDNQPAIHCKVCGGETHVFSAEQEELFQTRYEEGYDLPDPEYLHWLTIHNPESASADQQAHTPPTDPDEILCQESLTVSFC